MARRSSRRIDHSQRGLWILSLIVALMMIFALIASIFPDVSLQQAQSNSGMLPPVATVTRPAPQQ